MLKGGVVKKVPKLFYTSTWETKAFNIYYEHNYYKVMSSYWISMLAIHNPQRIRILNEKNWSNK